MIGTLIQYGIIILFLVIGIIAVISPQTIKNIQIRLNRSQSNLFKNTPGINKITEYNVEPSKYASLNAIRLTGVLFIIFIPLVLLFILK
jgi:hypothetical protein